MKKKLLILLFCAAASLQSNALNVTIIESTNPLYMMDTHWQNVCTSMGHTVTLQPNAFLDLYSNLAATDILIYSSGADNVLTPTHIANMHQYLQNGGKIYMQTEYDSSQYDTNTAFSGMLRSFGSAFKWQATISGTLSPMNILGSIATDYALTAPLSYFWYGCTAMPYPDVEHFLEYQGNYFGFLYCTPNGGRIITTSDQDWINQNAAIGGPEDSLMKNIIFNLAKTSYSCESTGVNELNLQISSLSVYPNPIAGNFNISFNARTSSTTNLMILDVLGREVFSEKINTVVGDNQVAITNPNLNAGIYLLQISSEASQLTSKISIK